MLIKLVGYTNSYTAKANLISYSSTRYEGTLKNTTNSTIKTKIDDWYKTNILNKKDEAGNSYASYLSDGIFCNDRSINTGSGNLLVPTTHYGAYKRLISSKTPTLTCAQEIDKFSVSDTIGNGSLTYPVGLLTAEEAAMAGGLYNAVNTEYYLYTGQVYWLASPSSFNATSARPTEWYVGSTGRINPNWVMISYGVRPVISLSADSLITTGDGTKENPYVIAY